MAVAKRSYTPRQAGERLGVCSQTVQRWADAGRLQAWRTPGGHRRIDADSADALLAELQATGRPARPLRVLVVDDRPLEAALLTEYVRAVYPDANVMLASDGYDGLTMVGLVPPDLVLADLAMPHMNGMEMIRRLRSSHAPAPAIVVVSALEPTALQALGGLPDGVPLLPKPVNEQACRQLLHEILPPGPQARAPAAHG